MIDDAMMRFHLQRVLIYRELCNNVRKTGRGNILYSLMMLLFAYFLFPQAGKAVSPFVIVYVSLAVAELFVGLFKWIFPSAEGILLDAFLLLVFIGANVWRELILMKAGGKPGMVMMVISVILLARAVSEFRSYFELRRLFADRPTSEQIAWFDDLATDIQTADPELDDQALNLPTRPAWKAKLIGNLAFFYSKKRGSLLIATPDEFEIVREKNDTGNGLRKARLRLNDERFPQFDIKDDSWDNYRKWMASNRAATENGESAIDRSNSY